MKRPLKRGTPIDHIRFKRWQDFIAYRDSVNDGRIDRWLSQFANKDLDLAARVLDSVEFISFGQVTAAFRSAMDSLAGWNRDPKKRIGRWRFAPFSGTTGKSGDSMLHVFRGQTGMNFKKYNELFIHRSELLQADLGPKDNLVFVDDIAGTGSQACDAWVDMFQELLPRNPNVYLLLVRASVDAMKRIRTETSMEVVSYVALTEADNIFSSSCRFFDEEEKKSILKYCKKANARTPKGYGECGFVVVFYHRCPNNSIPILHACNHQWEGLFPRH